MIADIKNALVFYNIYLLYKILSFFRGTIMNIQQALMDYIIENISNLRQHYNVGINLNSCPVKIRLNQHNSSFDQKLEFGRQLSHHYIEMLLFAHAERLAHNTL